MIEITLNENNLTVEIKDSKGIRKSDFNKMLKNIDMYISTSLSVFKAYYEGLKNNKDGISIKKDEAVKVILTSDLCLSHRIPPHFLKMKSNLNLSANCEDVSMTALDLINQPIYTTYHCKNNNDIISACLYHFICRGYLLKFCNECKTWFMGKGKVKSCSSECQEKYKEKSKKNKSKKELERQKKRTVKKVKQIRDMLLKREITNPTGQRDIFDEEYTEFKKLNRSEEEVYDWLCKKHEEYKIKKGGVK